MNWYIWRNPLWYDRDHYVPDLFFAALRWTPAAMHAGIRGMKCLPEEQHPFWQQVMAITQLHELAP
jgi:hypothetical protein